MFGWRENAKGMWLLRGCGWRGSTIVAGNVYANRSRGSFKGAERDNPAVTNPNFTAFTDANASTREQPEHAADDLAGVADGTQVEAGHAIALIAGVEYFDMAEERLGEACWEGKGELRS